MLQIFFAAVGASRDPCSDTYAGKEPFSEVETQAVRDYLLAKKNITKVYLTLHSYGQVCEILTNKFKAWEID